MGNREFSANQGNSVPEEMTNERDALAHILKTIHRHCPLGLRIGRPLVAEELLLDTRSCELQYFIGLGCSFP